MYIGKTGATPVDKELVKDVGKSGEIVIRLMEPLLNNGYKLFVDNWYSSPNLFQYLLSKNTSACGTTRKNRLKLPASFTTQKLPKGQSTSLAKDNLLALRYYDKRDVYLYQQCTPLK